MNKNHKEYKYLNSQTQEFEIFNKCIFLVNLVDLIKITYDVTKFSLTWF